MSLAFFVCFQILFTLLIMFFFINTSHSCRRCCIKVFTDTDFPMQHECTRRRLCTHTTVMRIRPLANTSTVAREKELHHYALHSNTRRTTHSYVLLFGSALLLYSLLNYFCKYAMVYCFSFLSCVCQFVFYF